MTHEERSLLLATARVLRAQIAAKHHLTKDDIDDAKALREALAPFDPKPDAPTNDEQRRG